MLLSGGLGFASVVFALVILCLVVRLNWRKTAARNEEVMKLLTVASEQAAVAEVEASAEYCWMPAVKPYLCAVCFCPTTTRCAQCKAVRYCSGKCQIIHWRQGHKNQCRPSFKTLQPNEGSNVSERAYAVNQTQMHIMVLHPTIPHQISSLHPLPEVNHLWMLLTKLSTLPHSNSIADFENSMPSSSEAKVVKSRRGHEKDHPKLKIPRKQTLILDGDQITSQGNKMTNGDTLSEHPVMDTSKQRTKRSSRSYSKSDERKGGSQLFEGKKVGSMSSSDSSDHPSASTEHCSVVSVNSAKCGTSHNLPSKIGSVPTMLSPAGRGLRKSVRKVVQQFTEKQQPNPDFPKVKMDAARKQNYEIVFPYKLFMQLYSCEMVELKPFGLVNCGNSCYANAVLQCLVFTRPLTSYLLQGIHSRLCQKEEEWCFVCEFECLLLKGMEGQSPLYPIGILSHIQRIGSQLGPGREEDAHEFLRYAIDTMQSVCLKEAGIVGPLAEESTLVGLTFGGYLHSKIKCMKCLGKSEQSERIMDLTVEIDGDIGTLEEALAQFTATEILDGENKYWCSRCQSYERAKKRLTIMEAPNILTIVLKRFQSGNFEKLNKLVRFPEVLNMRPYMGGTSDRYPSYCLYGVVVHLDVMNSAFSGHYVCYVKNFQEEWFKIDDSSVIPVELEMVRLERAYMLLYARHSPRLPSPLRSLRESSEGKIKRDFESIPSSYNGRKTTRKSRINSTIPSMNPSAQQLNLGEFPHRISPEVPVGNEFPDPYEWRYHSIHRVPRVDSWSDSSSIFSCSDAGSCSTESTKDSSGAEDISGYIFGEVTPRWYCHYGVSPGLDASSSLMYRRSVVADSSFPEN
ncbi:ubiquitin carboxyl-terminal hydrolase 17-like isoform X2 [Diospyros lotus]|uniref:ubiquitin carboxyl-terminal hydrolase 17-like isoform X2 n=1 Tax=Diospyros lotus TaxID=55363 RepID=UPI002251FC4C|nr:ubiquitin carboxyl-terminal hydrolase 17-like isoform X2 [Diospyros lotus]